MMRIIADALLRSMLMLFVFLFPGIATAADPAFVIVAPKSSNANVELGASLYRVLLGNGQRAKFEKAETIEEAVASKARLLLESM